MLPPTDQAVEAALFALPRPAPTSSRCRRRSATSGSASSTATRIPDLDGPLVEKWEQWYASRPDYVARMVERSRRYLYHIVTEVIGAQDADGDRAAADDRERVQPRSRMSVARAAGIWQFIPSTGKHYGLAQNFWVDSRRDVLAATDKALEYLTKLHDDFDDWQLALAGYNWGEGNVAQGDRAQQGEGSADRLRERSTMPAETRNYLPKLQAVKNIVRDPEKYGLALADIPDAPFFTVVKTTARWTPSARRRSPRCRSRTSWRSIRSTTGR